MIIKEFLKKKKRANFIFDNTKKKLRIIDIIKIINKNKLGFVILKEKNYKIITDGDIRRFICKKMSLDNFVSNSIIGSNKIVSIESKNSLYDASNIILKKKINSIIIINSYKIISYIQKDEIIEFLSPERLTVEKNKIQKYKTDLTKHFLRYNFASFFTNKNFTVLDAACGTGYGSFIISKNSKKVIGVDMSKTAIEHAKFNFKNKKINFIQKDINNLTYNKKFDMIISIETIEHLTLDKSILWLKKCKKMLKKNGVFICSSPMLRIKNNKPFITNPHHLYEMRKNEFIDTLNLIFKPKIFMKFIQDGSSFKPLTSEKNGLCFVYIKI